MQMIVSLFLFLSCFCFSLSISFISVYIRCFSYALHFFHRGIKKWHQENQPYQKFPYKPAPAWLRSCPFIRKSLACRSNLKPTPPWRCHPVTRPPRPPVKLNGFASASSQPMTSQNRNANHRRSGEWEPARIKKWQGTAQGTCDIPL